MAHLAKLTKDQQEQLAKEGLSTPADVVLLTEENLQQICPSLLMMQRRKLMAIGKYEASGSLITNATTMADINRFVVRYEAGIIDDPDDASSTGGRPSKQRKTTSTGTTGGAVDPSRGAPKVTLNAVDDFDGEPCGWDTWEKRTKATLGQTTYVNLFTKPPPIGDTVAAQRNQELYHMLLGATQEGAAGVHVHKHKNDGHSAWKALEKWYGAAETSQVVVDDARRKLGALRLDENTLATKYIANFIKYHQKLVERKEGYSDATRNQMFLNQITDEDYDATHQFLRHGLDKQSFEELTVAI